MRRAVLLVYQAGVCYERSACAQARYFGAASILLLDPGNKGTIVLDGFTNIASHRRYDGQVGRGNLRQRKVRLYHDVSTVQIGSSGAGNQMQLKSRSLSSAFRMMIRQVEYFEQTHDAV